MTDVEQIKQKANIVDFINEYVPLKKMGRNWRATCPFHGEKTPSFYVSPERQVWHCFGCGKGGDIFTFVMEIEKLEFVEALRMLSERTGVKLTQRLELTGLQKQKERLYAIHHLASEFYHFLLTKHTTGERARVYLKERKIRDETAKTFMLGYAPNSWDATGKYLRKKGFSDEELIQAGLVIAGRRNYDRFRGRLIFTIRDHRGQTVAFAGRLLDKDAKEAKYINSPETPIYTKGNTLFGLDRAKNSIRQENSAILVEGEFDLLSSFQDGVTNVVAIKGSALTEGQVELLRRFTDRLVFSLDSDFAGDAASRRGIELADRVGFLMSVVELPGGKDPDECVRIGGGLWKKALEQAIPVYDYFIQSAKKRFDTRSVEGKRRTSDELIPIMAKIENPIIRSHYTRILTEILAVSEMTVIESIEREIRRMQTKSELVQKEQQVPRGKGSRSEQLEDLVMAVVLQTEDLDIIKTLGKELHADYFTQAAVVRIFAEVKKHMTEAAKLPLYQHLGNISVELGAVLNRLVLVDISPFVSKEKPAWRNLIREFEGEVVRREIRAITTKIRQLESETDEDKKDTELAKLNTRLSSLTKRLRQATP